ncbi:hypothetical protein SAMN04489725_1353 [Alicyclobacillus hesperidum]|uniref:Uncharacterized protein n=1 Tax=Alicyclobacillus hesperidum TaxID=89784 RepID=A0A1H2YEQ7_9BACL|nr:type V CRISPR-associated protein Cas12b [Alicyclobacillus hesperidum]SDX03501.1 hypothetical protein SAMN04489725_1353 [Alicyclobacillus hesperidum]
MTVRSIRVKLAVGSPQYRDVRRGLWKTHEIMNQGVRYYCEWLVLMRQEPIYDEDEHGLTVVQRTREDIQAELLSRLRTLQSAHQHSGDMGTDEELLSLMRQLYEQLVPSSVDKNKSGDARMIARNFFNPLTNPNSQGGLGISNAGRKPKWLLKKLSGDPTWEEDYKKAMEQKQESSVSFLLLELRRFGLHPIFLPYTDTVLEVSWAPKKARQWVRKWDYDLFQQSIERMLSWESWTRRVKERFEKLVESEKKFYDENFATDPEFIKLAETLEGELQASSQGFVAVDEHAFQIRPRSMRGFDRVADEWCKLADDAPIEEYEAAIKRVQARLGRNFGSYVLFAHLAKPEYWSLWRSDPTKILRFARLRALQRAVARAKRHARLTLPDAIHHPIWIRYDAKGKNIYSYRLLIPEKRSKRYYVEFSSLIMPDGENRWAEHRNIRVPLAFSRQWERLHFSIMEDGSLCVQYRDPGVDEPLRAELGGAKIQFDRRYLIRRSSTLSAGECGPVYLNVSVDVNPAHRPDVQVLQSAKLVSVSRDTNRIYLRPENLSAYWKSQGDGTLPLRVMSVDLGVRSSAAVVICRLEHRDSVVSSGRRTATIYRIAGTDEFVAVQERAFLLRLPGEGKGTNEDAPLRDVYAQLGTIRQGIQILRSLLRLCDTKTPDERQEALHGLAQSLEPSGAWKDELHPHLVMLQGVVHDSVDNWKQKVISVHRQMERILGHAVREWKVARKNAGKPPIRRGAGGLSLRRIRQLEQERRTLVAWSNHAREPGQVVRIKRGTQVAQWLVERVNHLKEDRLKKLADLLIMTALGYVYDETKPSGHKWDKRYPPCQIILMEDLSRYRFQSDRPPSENSQLMAWSHRRLLEILKLQADLHKLIVGTVFPAFSSRFDAQSGAPGVRCRSVKKQDIENAAQGKGWLARELQRLNWTLEWLQPNDLIPTGDGELFVTPACCDRQKGIKIVHADLNAAQNLQRRFWGGHAESLCRVTCDVVERDGRRYAVPRISNAFADSFYKVFGQGVFVSTDEEDVYRWMVGEKISSRGRSRGRTSDEEAEAETWIDEAREQQGKVIALFRDASGQIHGGDWLVAKVFWGWVERLVTARLLSRMSEREAAAHKE